MADSPPDAVTQIEASIVTLLRRAVDPRGNRRLYAEAGVDLERSGSVMLARIEELEPARLSDLAAAAGVEMSTASRQVARLVDQGLVERAPDPEDRRAVLHRLTPEGRTARSRVGSAIRSWFERALAEFPPDDREQLAVLLGRFVTALVDQQGPPAEEQDLARAGSQRG
jgi:DNA-binding MarR family transcriptional regulator